MKAENQLFQSVDFRTSSPAIAFPRLALLSKELEEEWKQIERPFNAKAVQKDRKRYDLVIYCFLFHRLVWLF